MRIPRALVAANPRRFGRARALAVPAPAEAGESLSDDMKLFAGTFAGGFIFVSILFG